MKLKFILAFSVIVWLASSSSGQNHTQTVTAIQYFFDTDPGVGLPGNGAVLPVAPTANYNETVSIVVPGSLSTGFHNLYVRSKDEFGKWSLSERRLFYINAATQATTQDITAYQYFFDTDPGVGVAGNGAIVPVSQTSIYNASVSISVPGTLTTGFHNLYVRTQDVLGRWSLIERRLFYINTATSSATQDITAYQYYFDTDPGVGFAGNGAIVPVTPTSNYNASVAITVPGSLTTGFHNLYVRTQDLLGRWSLIERRLFYISTATSLATQDITAYQYYFDTDPGVGVSGNGAIVPVTQTSDYNASVAIPVPVTLTSGFHNLYVRTQDALGRWSLIERRLFYINTATSSATQDVTAYQYYFNSDPGAGVAGNGAIVQVTPTSDYNAAVAITIPGSLATGFHNLFVRTKDVLGRWSQIERRLFYINVAQNTSQTVTALEYYYDNDPGVGHGNSLVVTTASAINALFQANVPCLSSGTHYLYVRAKDEAEHWSIIERDTFTVTSGISASAITPAGPISMCASDSVTLSANLVTDVAYQWLLNGNAIAGDTTNTIVIYAAGSYSLKTTCGSSFVTSNVVVVSIVSLLTFYADNDQDGFGNIADTLQACIQPSGYVSNNADCNDTNNAIYPNASEICNGIDDDCDGLTDDNDPGVTGQSTWYADADVDGFGNAANSRLACIQPAGYVSNNTDCNDANNATHPGATEICNGLDDNCNNQVDEGCNLNTYYADVDGDGFGNVNNSIIIIDSVPPVGYVTNHTDCNDVNMNVHPGANEVCNGIDDDCDAFTDDADPGITGQSIWYADVDGDGFGNAMDSIRSCNQLTGYVSDNTDCNDSNSAIHPGGNAGMVSGTTPLCIGDTTTFRSNGDSGGSWSSSNTTVAVIHSTTGLVTAMSGGTTFIKYTVTGCNISVNATRTLAVSAATNAGTVSGTSPICIGASALYRSNGSVGGSWSSNDTTVAKVNASTGLVTGLGSGAATITYTVTGCGGTFTSSKIISVSAAVSAGMLNGTPTLCIVETTVFNSSGTAGGRWSSSNAIVATVDSLTGLVSAVNRGTATITYRVTGCNGNLSATKIITIIPAASAGSVSGASPLCIGAAAAYTSNGTSGGTWISSNVLVATIDSSTGLVTTISAGSTVISYMVNACGNTLSATKSLTVAGNAPVFSYSGNTNFTTSVVSPTEGEPEFSYRFEVSYTNVDGAFPAPGFPRLMLDFEGNGIFTDPKDLIIIMTPLNTDLDVTDGKTYFVNLTGLPLGSNWKVNFLARSTGGCETQSPPFTGPNVIRQPNLSIFANDITFSNNHPDVSSIDTVFAVIHNDTSIDAHNFIVHLINQYDTNATYPDVLVPLLPANSFIKVSWAIITPVLAAWVPMQVVIDYTDVIEETNELDNQAIRPFINGNFVVPGRIDITAGGASTSCQGGFYSVCGSANYAGTAVVLQDPSVAGATVTVVVVETGQQFTGFSNSLGNYCVSFIVPQGLGTYSLQISVTDFTITGENSFSFAVIECPPPPPPVGPDLKSKITLDAFEVFAGSPITGTVKITNVGNRPAGSSTADVYLSTTGSGFAQQMATPALDSGEFHTESFSFISPLSNGFEGVNSRADVTNLVAEIEERNNADQQGIRICPLQPDLAGGYNSLFPIPTVYVCDSISFFISNASCLPVIDPFDIQLQVFQNSTLVYSESRTIVSGIPRDNGINIAFGNIFPTGGSFYTKFSVDVNNSILEFEEPNNISFRTFNVQECKPELSISADCNPVTPIDPVIPGNITVMTTVANVGRAVVIAPFIVDFEVGGNHYPVTITSNMPENSSMPVSASFPTPPFGCPILTVTADATNAIEEYSEVNTVDIPLSWDFNLGRMCFEFDPEDPQPNPNFWEESHNVGSPVSMSVGLKNNFAYTASLVHTRFEVSGPQINGWLDLGFASATFLQRACQRCKTSDDTVAYKVTIPNSFVFPDTGVYQVRMTADINDRYVECNENNNVKIVDVRVTNFPDYRTLSRFIAPSLLNPEVGEPITFNVTYENIGATNIVDSLDILLKVDDLPHQTVRVKGLFSGSRFTAQFSNQWASLLPGLHVIRAIADARREVTETNELNNEATRSFVVGKAADLYFQVFSPDHSMPLLGQQITINTRIGNRGSLASEADVQFFFLNNLLDSVLIGSVHISVARGDSVTIALPWPVLNNTTTLIGKITNLSILQLRYDDKIATAQLGNFSIAIASVPGCFGGNNGTLTAVVSGGTPPFTFAWNTGNTLATLNAPPGRYTVAVTDSRGFIRYLQGRITAIPPPSFYEDADGDGYGNPNSIIEECVQPSGYVTDNTDCDDANFNIHPGATEVCNGIDDNCNGLIDEGVLLTFFQDEDQDGFGNKDVYLFSCSPPVGYVSDSTDCNDTRATAYPGANETCNGIDDNCNSRIDEGVSVTYYRDADGDGFGNPKATTQECNPPSGYVTDRTDCNDNNPNIHPGATEVCNGIDDNCNLEIDEGVQFPFYRDADGDGYGNPAIIRMACSAPAGYVSNNTDCKDNNSAVHPGATEVCNGIDDNCNGQIDEGVLMTFFRDADGDGFGNPAVTTQACVAPAGYVSNNTDCNDTNAAIYPGATEVCNGIDDNCNGQIDEGVLLTFFRDADGDGFGNPVVITQACVVPEGYVSNNTDCNDNNSAVHPGATEICNGIDDNCNGQIDEGVLLTFFQDADGDGFGNPAVTTQACNAPDGYVSNNTDCNDNHSAVYPGATEICNGIDDNCNGIIDEGCGGCNLVANTGFDEWTYFGYSADQTVSHTVTPTGGMPPYSFTWALNRPLKCNMVNSSGDESFSVSGGACGTTGSCPTSGNTGPVPLCTNSGNNSTVTTTLLDTGIVCVTVRDANGCSVTDCFSVNAIDARCFSGNSGNHKVKVCHRTGSRTNPWVQICVDESAVPALLALGDYLGKCRLVLSRMGTDESTDELFVYPNPAHDMLNIEFNSGKAEDYVLQLMDLTGRVMKNKIIVAQEGNNLFEFELDDFASGIYILSIVNSDGSRQIRVMIE